jgi:hypothetical protein
MKTSVTWRAYFHIIILSFRLGRIMIMIVLMFSLLSIWDIMGCRVP